MTIFLHLATPRNVSCTPWGCGDPRLRTTALEPFLFLNQLQISSAKKIRLKKNVEIMAFFKISRYVTALVLKVLFEKAAPLAFATFRNPCTGLPANVLPKIVLTLKLLSVFCALLNVTTIN